MGIVMEHLTDIETWQGKVYLKPNSPFPHILQHTKSSVVDAIIHTSKNQGISRIEFHLDPSGGPHKLLLPSHYLDEYLVKLDSQASKLLYNR